METCRECPQQYPWLGDAEGTGILGRDNYIYQSGASAPAAADGAEEDDGAEEQRRQK